MTEFKELMHNIEKRPAMYIGRKSLACLSAFLEGWCYAKKVNLGEAGKLGEFRKWLLDKLLLKDSHASWDRIILYYSQDDADALDMFFKLFNEFQTNIDNKY